MKRKVFSGIVLALLLISMLSSAFNIHPVKAKTIIVPDDYATIQAAVNAASPGDTVYVRIGTYDEHITVSKSLTLIGENRESTIIDGEGTGTVVSMQTNDAVIKGFTIQDSGQWRNSGIHVYHFVNVTIQNNNIKSNNYGIYLEESSNNRIAGNKLRNNDYGVRVTLSSNNTITENTVTNNEDGGVYLEESSNNRIVRNNITHNGWWGVRLSLADNNTIIENYITYNYYYGGISLYSAFNNSLSRNSITNNEGNGMSLHNSFNNTITENRIKNSERNGILLSGSANNTITQNSIANSEYGIHLSGSSNNVLRDNHMSTNQHNFGVDGWYLRDFVHDIDSSNTVDGKPVYYWINRQDGIVPPDAGYVALVNSYNIITQGLELKNNLPAILLANITNSQIRNNFIINGSIYVYESSENIIRGNNVTSGGIGLFGSLHNNVYNNTIYGKGVVIPPQQPEEGVGTGIYLGGSYNNVYDNTVTVEDGWGIMLSGSNNVLRRNNMTGSMFNFGLGWYWPQTLSDFVNDVDASNTVDGKPVFYWISKQNMDVPSDAGYVALINCTNITVYNLDLKNSEGILLALTKNSTIIQNTLTNNVYGVYLINSSNINLYGNTLTNNNPFWNAGNIRISYSSNVNIHHNRLTDGSITVTSSSNNSIYSNTLTYAGISIHYSSHNSIYGNTITNSYYGISLSYSNNTAVYHNNFMNNTEQAHLYEPYDTTWDDGYPSGGNYWSDYAGRDDRNGPEQDRLGSDGIGDTPYIIDTVNMDRYPLMNPWTPTPPTPDFSITASPASLTIQQGNSDTSVITITSINGFDQPIQLAVSGAPSGVTASLNPEEITPPPDGSTTSTLTVSVDTTATSGSYTLTVTGTSDSLTHSVDITMEITVLPPPEDQPPTCSIKLRKDGVEIGEIDVGEFFDIYVGDSTDDTGISQVRFSSDDVQDGNPTGEWTEWYDWDISSGDWNASTKIKRWAFATGGDKEVWAEVKDDIGRTAKCSVNIDAIGPLPSDNTPPASISDLWVVEVTPESITSAWKSPGDDGNTGVAQKYDIRYSTSPITEANWDSAIQIADVPESSPSGSTEVFTVTGLSWGTTYYFAIKTADEVPNWSGLSNVASGTTTMVGTTTIPYIGSIDRASGAPGIEIRIKGLNLEPSMGDVLAWVDFGGTTVTPESWTEKEVVVKVPPPKDTEKVVDVKVVLGITRESNPVEFTYNDPFIDRINPISGKPGEKVTISGKDFGYKEGHNFWVKFGNSTQTGDPWTDTEIMAEAPLDYGTGAIEEFVMYWLIHYAITGVIEGPDIILDIIEKLERVGVVISKGKIDVDVKVYTPAGESNVKVFTYYVDEYVLADLLSPGELRIHDSQGRVTGLVNGQVKEEIPYSYCVDNSILIVYPSDSYRYDVVGTEEGTYGLSVTYGKDGEATTFNATSIPASPNTIHQYTVDWDALSQDEEAVIVKLDSDGDGLFEKTFTAGSNLTRDEFMQQVSPVEAFPMLIAGIAVAIIAIATIAIAVFWRRRKQAPTKG